MNLRRIAVALFSMIALAIPAAATTVIPAQGAIDYGSKICESYWGHTYVKAKDIVTGATRNLSNYPMTDNDGDVGECTGYHYSANWRVDTDPTGSSHSYRTRYDLYIGGDWEEGNWNGCHYNSDNHNSDPANNGTPYPMRVVYENYDHGDCTN